jgi:hypothetical protein
LACLLRALQGANGLLAGVLDKAQFWRRWAGTLINARRTLVLERMRFNWNPTPITPIVALGV